MAKEKVYNPVAVTEDFKKRTADRGYGHFSAKAVELQKQDNDGIDVNMLRDRARDHRKQFMDAVKNPVHPDYAKNRAKFYSEHGGDQDDVENAEFQKLCDMVGYKPLPQRDTAYEESVLKQESKKPTADEAREHAVFCDLMKAKWDYNGYDDDDDVILDFVRGYQNVRKGSGSSGSPALASAVKNKMQPKSGFQTAASALKPGSLIANKMGELSAKYPPAGPLREV